MSEDTLGRGARLDAVRLHRLIDHHFAANLRAEEAGHPPTPLCLWGAHGLGKTMIIEDLARQRGWGFTYLAPAQFEEMGDLHGLPRHETVDGRPVTVFAPPAWVPTAPGPGILLLDDLNRADDRILRGLMQLLQTHAMFSWRLPPRWQIVATANPEGGDYSVTAMDDAMLTRMLHVSLVFEPRAWAAWAMRAGVDARGIDFVLTYPEAVTGRRTTPRSLTQFFAQIAGIEDLRAELDLVGWLASSALDDVTVAAFVAFVSDNLTRLITPEELLDAAKWAPMAKRVDELAGDGAEKRLDRLSALCTRLYLALVAPDYRPGSRHQANLVAFLLHAELPNDLRFALHRELLRDGSDAVKEMMRDAKLAKLLVAAM